MSNQQTNAFITGAIAAFGTTAVAFYILNKYNNNNNNNKSKPTRPPPPIRKNITGCVGNTPMVKLNPSHLGITDCLANIYAKLEFQNPGGSVKDRIAVSMIDEAERSGLITPGKTTLVEATSGNTGIAIAMVGAARGYKVVVAMPRLQAMLERYILIRSFGGQVLLSEPETKSQGFLDLAESYAKKHPNCYLMRQFTNDANPDAHYKATGPEIWEQMEQRVDAVVMGAGTGGTAVGVGRYMKEQNSNIKICVVEPTESRVMQGSVHRVHSIVGIGTGLHVPMLEGLDPGADFIPGKGRGIVDEFLSTDTPDSLDCSLLLATSHGLLVGPSTGAAVHAALELGRREDMRGKNIVVIAPSSGVRYLQHPMFKSLRREAFSALSVSAESSAVITKTVGSPETSSFNSLNKTDVVNRVEGCILALVRQLMDLPNIGLNDNLIDHGATSMTAMLLLGKLRSSLEGMLEGKELHGLKLAIVKERLWGTTRDLARGVVGVDEDCNLLPFSSFLEANILIEYCGG